MANLEVKFYDCADDALLRFAVIISRHNGKWVFCKHRDRSSYECPGGHREAGESILEAAERELREETGAVEFSMNPVCIYSVTGKNSVNKEGSETFGGLFYAEIFSFEALHSEIEKIEFFEQLPESWTYPLIQPKLIEEFLRRNNQ